MKTKLLLLHFLLPSFLFAQFTQIGADIEGEAADDRMGAFSGVSLSADGSIVAVGAYLNDGNGNNSGHVQVYQNTEGVWIQTGADIDGEAADDNSGHSVSLSADGSVVAIGAPGNDGNGTDAGHVRVYQYSGGSWMQMGSDIDGEATGDRSGYSVSLSADGNIVAIGAHLNDGYGTNSGHVRIYQNTGGTWTQVGGDIDGEAAGDQSGWYLSLSFDGSIVAIGAILNDGNGTNSGHVRIYQYTGGTWTQVGGDIDGEESGDESGNRLSLNAVGNIVAIGARWNDGNGTDAGHVRVYQYSGGSWTQVGGDIDGEAAGDISSGPILSASGNIVAIGAPRNDGNGTDAGHVRVYALPLIPDFEADNEVICVGSNVNFTDQSSGATSWSWTFEGGTPYTSIEENPVVSYDTPGYYDVSLTIMNAGGESETETKINYIAVLETPAQADMPSGDDQLCTGMTYTYTINAVPLAYNYEWELTPTNAGTIIGAGTNVEIEVSDTWTGDFTLRVRATNICGDGAWSNDFSGTVNLTPEMFDLIGGGEICEGDPGVEIELMDSEIGINYELYNNDVPTGNIVAGTGEGISFGLFTVEGNYTAYGSSANCSINMTGEVQVIVSLLPEQLTIPIGTTEVCNDDENDYTTTGAQGSDVVVWSLSPENAGEISAEGMTATIIWDNAFEGTATLTVLAENSCGAGPVSDALEIMVYSSPTPEVSGDDLVCKEEVSIYSTTENTGNTYGWEVIGGTITSGEGTSEITVTWGSTPGQGYVIVNESLELGCSAVDSISVTIDDCTGIEYNPENQLSVNPNPVTNDLITVYTGTRLPVIIQIMNTNGIAVTKFITSGESSQINLSKYPAGIYLLKATYNQKTEALIKFLKN